MDIQFQPNRTTTALKKKILSSLLGLLFFTSFAISANYTADAYRNGTGYNQVTLMLDRQNDTLFFFADPMCCCSATILNIFREDTVYISNKVNPATDDFVSSLARLVESTELIRERMKNLKQISGLLSFSDTGRYVSFTPLKSGFGDLDGCIPIDFNNPEDRKKYLEVIDSIEAGGDYNKKGLSSTAYGRYQFMPKTAAKYCSKVPAGMDCCGDKWKSSPACQDEMFLSFTAFNISHAAEGTPINSCTIYMMHQQGLGGFNWLMGGKNPYGSFAGLTKAVKNNVTPKTWQQAVANGQTDTEEELRQVMLDFWSKRLGGDVTADVGEPSGKIEDFTEGVDNLSTEMEERRETRKEMFRHGVILEQKRENFQLDIIKNGYDLKNSTRTIEIMQEFGRTLKEKKEESSQ